MSPGAEGGVNGVNDADGVPDAPSAGAARGPRAVRVAGVLVGLQGLAGLVFVVLLLAGSGMQTMTNQLGEAGYFAVLSAGVIAVAVGLVRGSRWARTPAVVVELLLIGVGWYTLGGSQRPEIGIPIAVYCLVVIVLLFLRASRAWATDDRSVDEGTEQR